MAVIKKLSFTLFAVCILIFAFLAVQTRRNPTCDSPLILGLSRQKNQPEEIAQRIVSELGGLPKAEMDIHTALEMLEVNAAIPVYPVQAWRVLATTAMNPEQQGSGIFSDESIYMHTFNIQVTYADGEEAILEWTSWNYGFVACPVVISAGTGPPGYLAVMP